MAKRGFGELEMEILCMLQSGDRKTVKEVHHALGEKNNYNTIMTVMSRLFEKGQLAREKMGLHYEYWLPSPSFSLMDKLKARFLGVKTKILVSHLIETAEDLSKEDLEEMEKIIQKARLSKHDI